MRTSYRQLFPSSFELWCVALASFALLIAGNAKLFLQRYGLISSSSVVHEQLTRKVGSGLEALDSFSITPGLVTFITWGAIGLIVFSIVHTLAGASGIIKYERELSSNRYVHPQNFNRDRYWKRILRDTAVSFLLLAALAAGALLYVLFVVPVGFAYAQRFLLHLSLPHLTDLGLGIFTILAGTLLLYMLLKAAVWHHRLSLR